ncbi:hypothetical protein E2C01_038606 [Portunus trituberculatus]|uniref:Uncharacterized protein n=1 Tax=Portunus trituberculatus TaxID=210409 RepID=A0A5B7FKJ3_PORTR|nr:hypothetical protein [Portunus trituberculatus]
MPSFTPSLTFSANQYPAYMKAPSRVSQSTGSLACRGRRSEEPVPGTGWHSQLLVWLDSRLNGRFGEERYTYGVSSRFRYVLAREGARECRILSGSGALLAFSPLRLAVSRDTKER